MDAVRGGEAIGVTSQADLATRAEMFRIYKPKIG